MKTLLKILAVLIVLFAAFLIYVATRPSAFRVERFAGIGAPTDKVFEYVNDVHKFQEWSPWADIDPSVKMTYDGPPAGQGASFSWSGNDQVGEGKMTIVESKPGELVRYKLEFIKPFAATNEAIFTLQPDATNTRVSWAMTGTNNFMFKAVGVFMNMDKMVGKDFEKGLGRLKTLTETGNKPTP